jgi:transcription termination/antitermination protein NusG
MAKQELNLGRNWYVLHTSSGYEDAVVTSLKSRIDSFDIGDKVFNIMVPAEKKAKMKNGKKSIKEEKMYPGYVFVEMIVDDNS